MGQKNVIPQILKKMTLKGNRVRKPPKKDLLNKEIRKKLGVTQVQLAIILNVSRASVAHIETGRLTGRSSTNTTLAKIFTEFRQLETGSGSAERSAETKLFLNQEYQKVLPRMNAREKDCRLKIKALKKEMKQMKERAIDAEHSIIVLTNAITHLKKQEKQDLKTELEIKGYQHLKEQAYARLLTCWEPEQATLHGRIEAIAGEAKALRRYRVKVMREHDPFEKKKDREG